MYLNSRDFKKRYMVRSEDLGTDEFFDSWEDALKRYEEIKSGKKDACIMDERWFKCSLCTE